ncbi:MAG TPA: 2,3,4,5-tetrahydropyridine-2,6-dicarboxylate N-succinyltransferase [Bacteroidales bacterium]|nr:2,3,4,5-tetrahydropyridine-2,6-dicarboxylate N-succinyltransferase [Bacteroidales bacterium]HRZ49085.1 2,3,4,5-tetrahydropyridine-2,6-dicarboxylate N-succinyltransferase [Bacteroidales bacterium]
MEQEKVLIERCWEDPALIHEASVKEAIRWTIAQLDAGKLRVAEPTPGGWVVQEWVKKAILLYFRVSEMKVFRAGDLTFHDRIPLKGDYQHLGVRVVPHAVARYGAYLAPGVIMMPSYVNIGAYVDAGTMVDTWATVGSCAQIGKNVHLSGGVGIGGVLEPLQAAPVIVEDNCFIGSRSIIVEGAIVETGAVIGANVVITGSTRIIEVTGVKEVVYRGRVPAGSVVIPGTYPKSFASGTYQVACALIIGKRNPSTDLKTSLNEVLREYQISV